MPSTPTSSTLPSSTNRCMDTPSLNMPSTNVPFTLSTPSRPSTPSTNTPSTLSTPFTRTMTSYCPTRSSAIEISPLRLLLAWSFDRSIHTGAPSRSGQKPVIVLGAYVGVGIGSVGVIVLGAYVGVGGDSRALSAHAHASNTIMASPVRAGRRPFLSLFMSCNLP